MISARNLYKQFGDLVAVADLSFDIRKGEVYGLLGPNGAGKTTTIQMLVGGLKPDRGTVEIADGGSPMQASVRRSIGVAPQALAVYEELSGEENLTFFGRLYGLSGSRLRQRVDYTLDLVGLTERRKDRLSTYSGGMQRRLNLACALVHDPPILVLDEPTVGVDPQSRNLIFDKIEMLKSEGRTVLYTTHYMEEAQRLCDHIAIMDHGRILAQGTLESLIAEHGGKSVVTASFESTPPADVQLPGEIEDGELRFESDTPLEDSAKLLSLGCTFRTLRIDRPDLETVFLKLTGRRLRD